MAGMVRRVRMENNGQKYTRRCDYCHQPRIELYNVKFTNGGVAYWLCPGNCFNQAQKNFTEKSNKGIHPPVTPELDDFTNETMEISQEGERNILGEEG